VNSDGSQQIRKAWTDHKDRDERKDLASWGSKYGSLVPANGRNRRSVWTVATQPYAEAHFATFPPALITPCILAGCPADGAVLDPFNGSGTTGEVSLKLGRRYVGIELNEQYLSELALPRITNAQRQERLFA